MKKVIISIALVLGASFGVYQNVHAEDSREKAPEIQKASCGEAAHFNGGVLSAKCPARGSAGYSDCWDEVTKWIGDAKNDCCSKQPGNCK